MTNQKLFNYMSKEHNVTLLETDMQEIRNIVNESSKVNEGKMRLRVEYTREKNELFFDNIPRYADWLEERLAKLEAAKNCNPEAELDIKK